MNTDIISVLKKTAMKSSVNSRHSAALINNNNGIYKAFYNKFIKKIRIKDNKDFFITIHAEISAVCNHIDKKNIKGMDIIVIRIDKLGKRLQNSRPCNTCIIKLKKLGIRKVFYSTINGDIVSEYIENMELLHECSSMKNIIHFI
jgi:cytidine deaminase